MDQTQTQNPINALLSEFGTRLNEMEEKQRLIKDRVLLIGENLIATKEEYENQFSEFKKQISQLSSETNTLKQINKRIVNELENFGRKSEFKILERQMKMFQPLELVRIQDIEKIVKKELRKQKRNSSIQN